jgi:regulatory protein
LNKNTKTYSIKDAKQKAARYCAYQERTQGEVFQKMRSLGLSADESEFVVAEMISEGFINEERYAKLYAGGKFRLKKWGKEKIKYALKSKNISDYCIKKGLEEIDDTDYRQTLEEIFAKKYDFYSSETELIRLDKVKKYLIQKGYEYHLINEIAKSK